MIKKSRKWRVPMRVEKKGEREKTLGERAKRGKGQFHFFCLGRQEKKGRNGVLLVR